MAPVFVPSFLSGVANSSPLSFSPRENQAAHFPSPNAIPPTPTTEPSSRSTKTDAQILQESERGRYLLFEMQKEKFRILERAEEQHEKDDLDAENAEEKARALRKIADDALDKALKAEAEASSRREAADRSRTIMIEARIQFSEPEATFDQKRAAAIYSRGLLVDAGGDKLCWSCGQGGHLAKEKGVKTCPNDWDAKFHKINLGKYLEYREYCKDRRAAIKHAIKEREESVAATALVPRPTLESQMAGEPAELVRRQTAERREANGYTAATVD
jgi:hypothetical protein